jgi:hypothetical protein
MRRAQSRLTPAEEPEVARPAEPRVVGYDFGLRLVPVHFIGKGSPAEPRCRSARDYRADLDLVVVLEHLAVGQELVATDHHRGAREDAELGEEAAHGATPDDLDRAPLGMKMDPHARPFG